MCNIREIEDKTIIDAVKGLFLKCTCIIGTDINNALRRAADITPSELEKDVLGYILKNNDIAAEESLPLCQDTGMAVIFAEYGSRVTIKGMSFEDAVNEGVRQAYIEGYLRKSVVADPLFGRLNTKDNTPAIIHTRVTDGNEIKLTAVAKGFGSENMSAISMMKPSDGVDGVKAFVIDTVKKAGSKACPPMVVGVGVGGTFEQCALLAKKATARSIDTVNANVFYAQLERELLESINTLDIGAAGFGGVATALGVNIEYFPTHIAGMPVAVNICCHASRHGMCII